MNFVSNSSKRNQKTDSFFVAQKEKSMWIKEGTRLAITWEGGVLEISPSRSKRVKTTLNYYFFYTVLVQRNLHVQDTFQ